MVEISGQQPLAEGSDPRLFVDWMWKLVDRFATIQQTSSGGDTWQANLEAGDQISVTVRADRTLSVSGPDHLRTDLQAHFADSHKEYTRTKLWRGCLVHY